MNDKNKYSEFILKDNMSHQPPMLLVDEILSETEETGSTAFTIRKDNIFLNSDGTFCRAAFVEIAAQSFAAVDIYQKKQKNLKSAKGFLAAVRDFSFYGGAKENDRIICEVHKFDEIGKLHFINAKLYSDKGFLFAQGEIRIYELSDGDIK
ncbi:MAG: hypothetical protein LBV16_09115 [Elusimicrobiota bacterium]|jgi:predicted hotdog family 3-hydroxylacyl-ACP dehydratase|nr:hypothetical protein [Elusimicrobiota bacterium]